MQEAKTRFGMMLIPNIFFGPHAGALYGKYDLLNELKAYKVRPASNELPYKFETGTQNHEGIAGVLGALEYLQWLGTQFGAEQESVWKEAGFTGRKLELKKGMSAMHAYESELSKALIKIVESVPGTHIYGITDMDRLEERVPTVSFTVEGKDPERIADELGNQGIYVWNGHNYALAIVERLRLLEAGGMIRVGPVHYNTLEELNRFQEVLMHIVA